MANRKKTEAERLGENAVVDELLENDNGVYLSERRLKQYTPQEIEELFGVPKDKQRVGWYSYDKGA